MRPESPQLLFAVACLASALLVATLAWHVPMMLWDHMDLLPVYSAWRQDMPWQPDIFQVHHGSHLHATTYALLLATAELSGSRPWLDCAISWMLLVGYAMIVLRISRQSLGDQVAMRWRLAIALLALYPGHLANLQWRWQVAVFLCR